jgi:hypothetical protein
MAYESPIEELYAKLDAEGMDGEEIEIRKELERDLIESCATLQACVQQQVEKAAGMLAGQTAAEVTEDTRSFGNFTDRFEDYRTALRNAGLFLATDEAAARWNAEAS